VWVNVTQPRYADTFVLYERCDYADASGCDTIIFHRLTPIQQRRTVVRLVIYELFVLTLVVFAVVPPNGNEPELNNKTHSGDSERSKGEKRLASLHPEDPDDISVEITPTDKFDVSVRGRVFTHDGKPVAGATVRLNKRVLATGGVGQTVRDAFMDETHTNDAGEYEFRDVETAWPYRIVASTATTADGVRVIADDGTLGRDETTYDIILKEPVTVNGLVTDEEGRPLNQVRVSDKTFTDEAGKFSIVYSTDETEYGVELVRQGYVRNFARTSPDKLSGNEWKLVLYRQESLQISGRATFVDGSPVSNSRIKIEIEPIEPTEADNSHEIAGLTDIKGNFTVTLPKPIHYSAVANAYEKDEFGGSGRQWACDIPSIRPAQPLHLEFDNRGRIHVDIKDTKLPDGYAISIGCYQVRSNRWMVEPHSALGKSSLVLKGLEPGQYRVYAMVPRLTNKSWSEEVTVPDAAPCRSHVSVTVPEFETGELRATFLMPDGETRASGMEVYVEGAGTGRSVKANELGEIHVKNLIAGFVQIEPRRSDGVAEVAITGHRIVAGAETNLGTIRLKNVDEEFGWTEGTLTYDDGVAVPTLLTSQTGSVLPEGGWQIRTGPSDPGIRILDDGRFRLQLRQGKQNIVFEFRNRADRFSQAVVRFGPDAGSTKLVVPVEVKAGKTSERKLVLKRSRARKPVVVSWTDKSSRPEYLAAIVEQDRFWWVQNVKAEYRATAAEFTQLPAGGDCFVLARVGREFFFSNEYRPVRRIRPSGLIWRPWERSPLPCLTIRVIQSKG